LCFLDPPLPQLFLVDEHVLGHLAVFAAGREHEDDAVTVRGGLCHHTAGGD
jgi:hypothetical protein